MIKHKRILLIPLLLPFIAILTLGIFNTNKSHKVTLLTWDLPEANLGLLVISGYSIGAIIGFLNIYPQLPSQGQVRSRKYKKVINKPSDLPSNDSSWNETSYNEEEVIVPKTTIEDYLERDIRDPKPTIQTSFRVIRKTELYDYEDSEEQLQQRRNTTYEDPYESNIETTDEYKNQDNDWQNINSENW